MCVEVTGHVKHERANRNQSFSIAHQIRWNEAQVFVSQVGVVWCIKDIFKCIGFFSVIVCRQITISLESILYIRLEFIWYPTSAFELNIERVRRAVIYVWKFGRNRATGSTTLPLLHTFGFQCVKRNVHDNSARWLTHMAQRMLQPKFKQFKVQW